jgi:hypothetical protein
MFKTITTFLSDLPYNSIVNGLSDLPYNFIILFF